MNNKHTVSKEQPIAQMGLVISQELCWSHTWRVRGASFPTQADAYPK